MPYYHLARESKLRINEYLGKMSQHYTQRRKAGHYIWTCIQATQTALTQKKQRALEANEQSPWPSQCMKTPDVSSRQVAEYTWYIWMGGQSVVPGRKWTPDRFGRCNRFSVFESQYGISVSRALETSPTWVPPLAVLSVHERPGLSIPELYIFPTN